MPSTLNSWMLCGSSRHKRKSILIIHEVYSIHFRIGTDVVIRRVRELFVGHSDLIVGFNTFIPQGYRVENPVAPRPPTTLSQPGTTTIAYSTEVISPAKLPSFSAFRHADASSLDCPNAASTLPISFSGVALGPDSPSRQSYFPPASNATTNTVVSTVNNQPPVLRSHLTTDLQQQQPQTLTVIENQDVILRGGSFSGHVVYPPQMTHQQQAYAPPNAQQQQSFSHAINYVNKVKNRFQAKPEVYKHFLEILQWYQREQSDTDSARRKTAELQVYQDMAKLLHGHEDLLQEFSSFLPESTDLASHIVSLCMFFYHYLRITEYYLIMCRASTIKN